MQKKFLILFILLFAIYQYAEISNHYKSDFSTLKAHVDSFDNHSIDECVVLIETSKKIETNFVAPRTEKKQNPVSQYTSIWKPPVNS